MKFALMRVMKFPAILDYMTETTKSTPKTHEAEISNEARATLTKSDAFTAYMSSHWENLPVSEPSEAEVAPYAAKRRAVLSAAFPGKRLVIPAGILKQRANDTNYVFRANTAFSHLTGWGSDAEPGAVLVFDPIEEAANDGASHRVTLYSLAPAGRGSTEFFDRADIGEFWVGPRPSLQHISKHLGINTADLSEFVAGDDDLGLEDAELSRVLAEMRLVKDEYEVREMQAAVDATALGFDDVVENLPRAIAHARGERIVDGVFHARARLEGHWVGYETIAASGAHACVLHWGANNGPVNAGDLLLLDAGVEVDSLYTADITRTLPVSGEFSPLQRKVYQAVYDAAEAAFAAAKPGVKFHEVHDAALAVIEERVREWGLIPAEPDPDVPFHKRFMIHGTCHHLGIDVHDCAEARREMYYDGVLEEGMVFTIEPGLYFHPGDATVPEEYWGIGVRIEDDVVVTKDGVRNLSADIPRTADAVEAWVKTGKR